MYLILQKIAMIEAAHELSLERGCCLSRIISARHQTNASRSKHTRRTHVHDDGRRAHRHHLMEGVQYYNKVYSGPSFVFSFTTNSIMMLSKSNIVRVRYGRMIASVVSSTRVLVPPTALPPSSLTLHAVPLRFLSDDSWNSRNDNDHKQQSEEKLEQGSQHVGVVRSIQDYGVFVRIDGMSHDGLVHVSEISNEFVENPRDVLSIGDRVQVSVLSPSSSNKLNLSMRRVKKILSDRFQPCTVAVFGLPVDMSSDDLIDTFNRYGNVLDLQLLPMTRVESEHLREVSFVTFETRNEAMDCIENLKMVTMEVGRESYDFKIAVKMGRRQTYKEELQQQLDEEHEQRQYEGTKEHRLAQKVLRKIIPYAFHKY